MANSESPSQEIPIPNMAGALQVLRKMPPKVLVDRTRSMEERAKGSIGRIVVCILFAVINRSRTFEYEADEACSTAADLILRLYDDIPGLCDSEKVATGIAMVAFEVWTWAGSRYGNRDWSAYSWRLAGNIGAIFGVTVLENLAVRAQFKSFCAEDEGYRWKVVNAWLEGRVLMLKSEESENLQDLKKLAKIAALVANIDETAARVVLDGEFPILCLSMLAKSKETSSGYVATAAHFIQALTYRIEHPREVARSKPTKALLRGGILRPLRAVILQADEDEENQSYDLCWKYLKLLISAMIHYRAVPDIARAFAKLPKIDDEQATPLSLEKWRSIERNVKLFAKGYIQFRKTANGGICDNRECQNDNKILKACSACGRAVYCGRLCQAKEWKEGHRSDCELYQSGVSRKPAASTYTKMYLAHVLGFFILEMKKDGAQDQRKGDAQSDRTRKEGQEPVAQTEVRILNIGPRISQIDGYSIQSLHEYAIKAKCPTQFIKMIETAKGSGDRKLAVWAVSEPPKDRFYVFSLFEEKLEEGGEKIYAPVIAMEVAGLDGFVLECK